MGVLQKIAGGFLDGWNNADRGKQKYKPYKPSEIDLRRYDRDFEFRLMRARTEPMEVLEYSNEAHTAAKIKSCTSGKTYNVTERQCECEDYQKNHKPCKHIIFLLLKNGHYKNREVGPPREQHKGTNSDGRFVPLYGIVTVLVKAAEKQREAGTLTIPKYDYVEQMLEARGIKVTAEVKAMIEAAVKELDIAVDSAIGALDGIFVEDNPGKTDGEKELNN